MEIQLSEHFTYKKLLKFTFSPIVMMIFTSIYGVVDGFFVSNFVGKSSFTAVNFIMPYLMILGSFGFMFGTGGSALIAKTLGEGKREKANEIFSMLVYATALCGIVIGAIGILLLRPAATLLGAEGELADMCVTYGRIVLAALPLYMLQFAFQSFFSTAEKPNIGLYVTVASGVSNMVLDALFMAAFGMGLVGAALATAISQCLGAVIPVIYFTRSKQCILHLGRTTFDCTALIKTCTNGSSELMSNVSMSLVGMLYNVQLMKYAGNDGVAAYGVMMYVTMIFLAIFIGYSVGTAPVVGYHYGAQNRDELKSLLRKSTIIIVITSLLMVALGELLAFPLSKIFVGYDEALLSMTGRGFLIYSVSFLFSGIAIYGSSFFTALNDGLTSAVISFLRTVVFQVAAVILLPLIWKLEGIWASVVAAELVAAAVTVAFILGKKKKYGYI